MKFGRGGGGKKAQGMKALMGSMMPAVVGSEVTPSSGVSTPKGPKMKSFGKRKIFGAAVLLLAMLLPSRAQAQGIANPLSKLGWDQVAPQTLATASAATYNLYIDGSTTAIPLLNVTCATAPTNVLCQAPFPAIPPGIHTVALTQKMDTESAKSAPLLSITFTVVVTPSGLRIIGGD